MDVTLLQINYSFVQQVMERALRMCELFTLRPSLANRYGVLDIRTDQLHFHGRNVRQ